MLRIRTICMMLQLCLLMDAQPLSCEEDAHCSEGYYCATRILMCQECLQCHDLNRFAPDTHEADSCIQTIESCGTCFEGFVNIYENHAKGKCVSPDLLLFESKSFCFYVWVVAVVIGSCVVLIFVYVIKITFVLRIVPNFGPTKRTQIRGNTSEKSALLKRDNPVSQLNSQTLGPGVGEHLLNSSKYCN